MRNGSRITLVVMVLFASVVGGIAVADGQYTLSVANSVDTPTRTLTLEGEPYQVSAIAKVRPGERLSFSTEAPEGADYSVYLYNDDREIVDTTRMTGPGSKSFPTEGYDTGSYLLVINGPDGNYRTIFPVVLAAYETSLSAPSSATTGEQVTFDVDLTAVDGTNGQIDRVEVVLSKGGEDTVLNATKQSEGTYTATATIDDAGAYLVYTNVRGTETVEGRKEILGVSDAHTLEVTQPTPTPTATATEEPNTGGSGGTDQSTTTTATETHSPTPTATQTATASPTDTDSAKATPSKTTSTTPTRTETQTTTTSNVITPASPSDQGTQTTGGLSLLVPIVAVALALLGVRNTQ